MNTPIVGGAAALLLVWLWLSRQRTPQLLRSTDGAAIAALNREQIAALRMEPPSSDNPECLPVVDGAADGAGGQQGTPPSFPAPGDGGARTRLLREWSQAYATVPAMRLQVMRLARAWGHPATLPLVRRGLRAPDPAVVQEAALAMARFRGGGQVAAPQAGQPRLPRNVARTR
ncbi:MAG: hypothetical protein FJ054_03705 [Cyanobacteria bacterium M_surface_10_m2_119]|nr:hypothetical protein [Cyanobacteria bacterium M_surface_10_m2_119]